MNPNREEALFAPALEKPAEKRASWLDAVCEGDVALRARLAAHEASSGILGNAPVREVLTSTMDLPEPAPDDQLWRAPSFEEIAATEAKEKAESKQP